MRTTGPTVFLNWWAGSCAVRAKYTAVTMPGFKQCATAIAFIKPLAGIAGHGLGLLVATFGAGDR